MLEPNPRIDLKVYAVWFNVLLSDDRSSWPDEIFDDRRVTEYWDAGGATPRWFGSIYGARSGSFAWDVYYLFGPEARWDEQPPEPASSGSTIVARRGAMSEALVGLFSELAVP